MIEPRLGNSVLQTATTREGQMARIVVQADDEQTVLLDERSIKPEHISDRHPDFADAYELLRPKGAFRLDG